MNWVTVWTQRRADVHSSARIGTAAALTIVLVVLLVLDVRSCLWLDIVPTRIIRRQRDGWARRLNVIPPPVGEVKRC